jgi:hypothetical protein
VAHEVNVAVGRREVGERGIAAEEGLDLTFLESTLPADEESRVGIGACREVVTKERHEASKEGFLARNSVFRTEDPNLPPFQVDVRSVERASLGNAKTVEVNRGEERSIPNAGDGS